MGRKSKLTPAQWEEVERRLLAGETPRAIARDYPITEAAIRQRKTSDVEKIKDVANQIVSATQALRSLPITSQTSAQTFAAKLLALSDHALGAATYGMATAHRLQGIANGLVAQVDDANPLESMSTMKAVAVLTDIANKAAHTGLNLIAANKDRAGPPPEEVPSDLGHFYGGNG